MNKHHFSLKQFVDFINTTEPCEAKVEYIEARRSDFVPMLRITASFQTFDNQFIHISFYKEIFLNGNRVEFWCGSRQFEVENALVFIDAKTKPFFTKSNFSQKCFGALINHLPQAKLDMLCQHEDEHATLLESLEQTNEKTKISKDRLVLMGSSKYFPTRKYLTDYVPPNDYYTLMALHETETL